MKSDKKLLEVFNKIPKNKRDIYYSFDNFKSDAKDFIKDVRTRNTFCTIKLSKSGMSRTFNFHKYNMLLNICYNQTANFYFVKVSGWGMDMHWYLKFKTCQELMTKKEIQKYSINSLCSSGHIL